MYDLCSVGYHHRKFFTEGEMKKVAEMPTAPAPPAANALDCKKESILPLPLPSLLRSSPPPPPSGE